MLKQFVKEKKIFNAFVIWKTLSIESHRKCWGKKVRHTFNEGTFTAKVISTVSDDFRPYYNLTYDSDLDREGNEHCSYLHIHIINCRAKYLR